MKNLIEYSYNRASAEEIASHLRQCEENFIRSLSERVVIDDYAAIISNKAIKFEARVCQRLIGLAAMYCDPDKSNVAHITNVSVLRNWWQQGIANSLIRQCMVHAINSGMSSITLEVESENEPPGGYTTSLDLLYLAQVTYISRWCCKSLPKDRMESNRNYDVESRDADARQYAYRFDFDIMHPYMIKSFEPFFNQGSLLELGCFRGDFTQHLLLYFDDITCIEASEEASQHASKKLGKKVTIINSTFEEASLSKRYDNIVMTHVLEHLDDPISALTRINNDWLAPNGRLFLVCPNANAPSRQIAVKMGLLTHNAAVTAAEAAHGHRCTYALDTLERDTVRAGLNTIHRSGIFFKALANFQWDRLLETDIISSDYLDGCYKLGHQYPDLCSSIFLVCETGISIVLRSVEIVMDKPRNLEFPLVVPTKKTRPNQLPA